MDLALEARALKVGDLQEAGCMEPEAHARDGGAGDLMMEGSGRWQEPPDFLHPEDGGETVGAFWGRFFENGHDTHVFTLTPVPVAPAA